MGPLNCQGYTQFWKFLRDSRISLPENTRPEKLAQRGGENHAQKLVLTVLLKCAQHFLYDSMGLIFHQVKTF